ncbi:unnamed protein product, partial [Symbiodinium microadriaticum]
AAKVWKKSQNQKTWAKKKASLDVLRQKEKEGEEASQPGQEGGGPEPRPTVVPARKAQKKWEASISELFEVPEAEKPIGDETKAGEDKRVDIEEELFGHIPDE